MATKLVVPEVGESITEVEIGEWKVAEGDAVKQDDVLVEIETEKVTQELYAPADGTLTKIAHPQGDRVPVGEVIGTFSESAAGDSSEGDKAKTKEKEKTKVPAMAGAGGEPKENRRVDAATAGNGSKRAPRGDVSEGGEEASESGFQPRVMPAARRLLEQHGLDAAAIEPTGPGGRVLKEDVQRHLDNAGNQSQP